MNPRHALNPAAGGDLARCIGEAHGTEPGPTLLVVAGIHGNEPAGVEAARRVLARLPALRGDFVCLAGNLGALAAGARFLQRDLNRGWTPARLAALPAAGRAEDGEQRDLHEAIESVRRSARGPVHVLDLHTTSADGIPFAMVGRSAAARAFALHFPLPALLGLLELVDGTLLEYLRGAGCIALGVEAGQNAAPRSVDHHEAVLWIALAAAGLVPTAAIPDLRRHRDLLARTRGDLPRFLRIDARHAIGPADRFEMVRGFANIQRVRRGELLAHDARGEIRAPHDAILLMPLYQAQGDDGYFLGRAVHPARIRIAAAARRLFGRGR